VIWPDRHGSVGGVTVRDVVRALHRAGAPCYARELDIDGSMRAIGSALRHGHQQGLVKVVVEGLQRRGAVWSLTRRGRRLALTG
jgi:hypothetical protein